MMVTEFGADLSLPWRRSGNTLLWLAAFRGHAHVVKTLVVCMRSGCAREKTRQASLPRVRIGIPHRPQSPAFLPSHEYCTFLSSFTFSSFCGRARRSSRRS